MCIIVDANCASSVFISQSCADFKPVRAAILGGKATGVYGGKLTKEYRKLIQVWRVIVQLDRAGRMRLISSEDIDKCLETIQDKCRSNDPHIIALALASKVRLLCSHDQRLHEDFTNPKLLKPKGNVYQNTSHTGLIRRHCSNGG